MPNGQKAPSSPDSPAPLQPDALEKDITHLLEEARMLLPGIQALFGFQLIVAFNKPFYDLLGSNERKLHLLALGLVAIAAGMIMTPAAFHRIAEPEHPTRRFERISTRLLSIALIPLVGGICCDIYLIALVILNDWSQALACTLIIGTILTGLWFVFPLLYLRQRRR